MACLSFIVMFLSLCALGLLVYIAWPASGFIIGLLILPGAMVWALTNFLDWLDLRNKQ